MIAGCGVLFNLPALVLGFSFLLELGAGEQLRRPILPVAVRCRRLGLFDAFWVGFGIGNARDLEKEFLCHSVRRVNFSRSWVRRTEWLLAESCEIIHFQRCRPSSTDSRN